VITQPLSYASRFGSPGRGEGQFNGPADVAVSSNGALWVLDRGNDRVEEFNEAGEYVRQFGSAGTGEGQFDRPAALALDSSGDIWVLDAETAGSRSSVRTVPI
jgi:DNA-binding beta-propeller fold protein YncE